MKSENILHTAADLVGGPRAQQHGDKHELHKRIACMWSAYLGYPVHAVDVAQMMALLKMARSKMGGLNPDDFIDQCGYSAIAGELALKE